MEIKKAIYLESNSDWRKCPKHNKPEFAFIGRSNVGKSSLINRLANHKDLAKTSSKPGKTLCINHFFMNESWYLVDLPGYGYAKVSKEAQNRWQKYLEEYLLNRKQIKSLIQFIDARHEIQKNDYQMREWVLAYDLPIFTIVTKIDLISKNDIQKRLAHVRKEFGGEVFPFSTNNRQYFEDVINHFLFLTQQSKEQYE